MHLFQLQVRQFRGIRHLDWNVGSKFACLVGPGDSAKTTILSAIEFVLSPRWRLQFCDSDFYLAETNQPIEIIATIGQLANEFTREAKFGLMLRGWDVESESLNDEPQDGDEPVLSVRLTVDASLEPKWAVVNDRSDAKSISAKDRAALNVLSFGPYVERHLSWSEGSALASLTERSTDLRQTLATVGRVARSAVDADELPTLKTAAARVADLGIEFGVTANDSFGPQLDARRSTFSNGGFALHDGVVPARQLGLGTRNLLTMAIQRELSGAGGVALVDEVETGLEPHRIRNLLTLLRTPEGGARGQVVATTHSPVVIQELTAADLRVVRAKDGIVEVLPVPEALQPVLRKRPGAMLGSRLIVCEGKTELGLGRALDRYWAPALAPFASTGTVLVNGGGTEAPGVAVALASLGFDVLFLGDSDVALTPDEATMSARGVSVVLWADDFSIEQRIAADLPWEGVVAALQLAVDLKGAESVRGAVAHRLGVEPDELSLDVSAWPESDELRNVIGLTAKSKAASWFKRVDLGEALGDVVTSHLDHIPETDLALKLDHVRKWLR